MICDADTLREIDDLICTVKDKHARNVMRRILRLVSKVEEKTDGNFFVLKSGSIPYSVSTAYHNARQSIHDSHETARKELDYKETE